jgi:hypothetical protein
MATKDQEKAAIRAVKSGVASREQEDIARRAAQQAGSTGNAARAAFQQKGK